MPPTFRLQHFPVSFFAVIMGLSGLTIAWDKAHAVLIPGLDPGRVLGLLTGAVFLLMVLTFLSIHEAATCRVGCVRPSPLLQRTVPDPAADPDRPFCPAELRPVLVGLLLPAIGHHCGHTGHGAGDRRALLCMGGVGAVELAERGGGLSGPSHHQGRHGRQNLPARVNQPNLLHE